MTDASPNRPTAWSAVKQKRIRIIPRLDIKGQNLIKGVQLEGLRVVGDPEEFAKKLMVDRHVKRYEIFQKKFDTYDEDLMKKIKRDTEMILLSENL